MKIELTTLLNLPVIDLTSVEMTDQKLVIQCRSCWGEAFCPSCLRPTQEVKTY